MSDQLSKVGKCTCVYATARNTTSVASGHEMGGYVKEKCEHCHRIESATTPAEVGDEILAWRFDYCGTHAMVWLNRPADAAMFANVTPLVDARYAATLARQLAGAKAEIAALSDDVAEYQRNIDAESFALTKAESALAATTRRVAEVEGLLREAAEYTRHPDYEWDSDFANRVHATLKEPK